MKKEFGSTQKVIKAIIYQCVLAWLLATMVYQIGIRIESSSFNFANLLIIGIVVMVIVFVLTNTEHNVECKKCSYCKKC